MKMQNKTVIVTGAASGIGKKIAQTFCAEGARVCIADIDKDAAEKAAAEIANGKGEAMAVAMDVTDEGAVDDGVKQVVDRWGGVDVLVSNAGIQHIDPIDQLALKDWRKVIDIHLQGGFLTTRACLREMYKADRGGTILYMGSVHSKSASPLKAPYVSAKHALLGLCRVVAVEGAKHGVRSSVICPGFVRTPLVDKQIPQQAKDLGISEEEVVQNVMLKETVDGEFTTTDDVAQVALFLASFPTNALTGQSLVVSHGWDMD